VVVGGAFCVHGQHSEVAHWTSAARLARIVQVEEAAQNPDDVDVDQRNGAVPGEAADGGADIISHPGQRTDRVRVVRQIVAEAIVCLSQESQDIVDAPCKAERVEQAPDFVPVRRGAAPQVRIGSEKTIVDGCDLISPGATQHELGDGDAIGRSIRKLSPQVRPGVEGPPLLQRPAIAGQDIFIDFQVRPSFRHVILYSTIPCTSSWREASLQEVSTAVV